MNVKEHQAPLKNPLPKILATGGVSPRLSRRKTYESFLKVSTQEALSQHPRRSPSLLRAACLAKSSAGAKSAANSGSCGLIKTATEAVKPVRPRPA